MINNAGIDPGKAIDQRRVEALKRYKILDSHPEKSFDNVAKLATELFNLPVALITFVDTANIFLKSNIGIDTPSHFPRNTSLCAITISNDLPTIIENIHEIDPATLSNPLVAAELGFKFYAGTPITTYDGFSIGALSVFGMETRTFTSKESDILKRLAAIVMDQIELRLQGILDAENNLLLTATQASKNFNTYSLLANAPVAIGIVSGRDFVVEVANPKILEVWDKSEDIIGKTLKQVFPELVGQGYFEILEEVLASGLPFYGNELHAVLRRNGVLEDTYFNFVNQPLKDISGTTISIMIVATEITEQVKARKQLETSEANYGNVLMNTTVGMAVYKSRELIIETANDPMYEIWQMEKTDVIGKSLLEVFPHVDSTHFLSLLHIFDSKEGFTVKEFEIIQPDPQGARHLYLDITYIPLLDAENNVSQIIVTASDVTEMVKTRKVLDNIDSRQKDTNEQLILAIREMSDSHKDLDPLSVGTFYIDLKTSEMTSSIGLKRLHGYNTEDAMTASQAIAQITDEHRETVLQAIDATINEGVYYNVEYQAIGFRDHKPRWLRAIGMLDKDNEGNATHFSGVAFEIEKPSR